MDEKVWNIWNSNYNRWFMGTLYTIGDVWQNSDTPIPMTRDQAQQEVDRLMNRQGTFNFEIRRLDGSKENDKVIISSVPINDRKCSSCGNERCSSTESSCWLCGAKLS